jgi:dihydrofolate synthase/folylpolyglutamate synthase
LVFDIDKHSEVLYDNLEFDFAGEYQQFNIVTILQSIEVLRKIIKIDENSVINGLKNVVRNTGIMGRWQILRENPKIICDVGHNHDGISQIVKQLKNTKYNNLHFVFGVVKDKDVSSILRLLPENALYYFTKASIERALDENSLYNETLNYNLNGNKYSTVQKAIEAAVSNAKENDLIFIGGSTFVVAEALEFLLV